MIFNKDILRVFCRCLRERGYNFTPYEDMNMVKWCMREGSSGRIMPCSFRMTGCGYIMTINTSLKAEPGQFVKLAMYLSRMNRMMEAGVFELDWDTGEVSLELQLLYPADDDSDIIGQFLECGSETAYNHLRILEKFLNDDQETIDFGMNGYDYSDSYDDDADEDLYDDTDSGFYDDEDQDSYDDDLYDDDDDDNDDYDYDIYSDDDDDDDDDDTDPDKIVL